MLQHLEHNSILKLCGKHSIKVKKPEVIFRFYYFFSGFLFSTKQQCL